MTVVYLNPSLNQFNVAQRAQAGVEPQTPGLQVMLANHSAKGNGTWYLAGTPPAK